MIVDDGSNDNTREIIDSFILEKIKIQYIYQKNQGRHIAINTALNNSKTKFMICLDSDDLLSNDAVEVINNLCKIFKKIVWGIVGPRVDFSGKKNPTWKIQNYTQFKLIDLYQKYKYVGDTFMIFDVSKAKKFIFPIFQNEKFIPEKVLYNRLDELFDIIVIDFPIYLSEYFPDGLINGSHKTFVNSLNGFAYSNYINASCSVNTFSEKIKSCARFLALRKLINFDKINISRKISFFVYLLSYILLPAYFYRYKKIIEVEKNEN